MCSIFLRVTLLVVPHTTIITDTMHRSHFPFHYHPALLSTRQQLAERFSVLSNPLWLVFSYTHSNLPRRLLPVGNVFLDNNLLVVVVHPGFVCYSFFSFNVAHVLWPK